MGIIVGSLLDIVLIDAFMTLYLRRAVSDMMGYRSWEWTCIRRQMGHIISLLSMGWLHRKPKSKGEVRHRSGYVSILWADVDDMAGPPSHWISRGLAPGRVRKHILPLFVFFFSLRGVIVISIVNLHLFYSAVS